MLEFNYKELPQSLMGHPVIVKNGEDFLQRINMYRIVGIKEEPIPMYIHELIQHGFVIVDIKENGIILLHKGVDVGENVLETITVRDILKEEEEKEEDTRGGHSWDPPPPPRKE